jgi:hypothetical protein
MMIGSAAVPNGFTVGNGTSVGGTAVGGTAVGGTGVAVGPHAVSSITAATSMDINTKTFFIFLLLSRE